MRNPIGAARAFDKISRGGFLSSSMASQFGGIGFSSSKGFNDESAGESLLGRETRNMSRGDCLNHKIASLSGISSNLHDALYFSRYNYSTHYSDKSTRELTNKAFRNIPSYVKIVEVGPRDGLQNEKEIVPTAVKVELIKILVSSGLPVVEATSFVSPKWVPQLADAKDVMEAIQNVGGARFPVLTPNLKGFEAAIAAGAKEVAIFASASESFSKSNINCSIEDSLMRYRDVVSAARELSIPVCGYISCVVGCPLEGMVPPSKVACVAKQLCDMGCYEIALGDTIGVGTPGAVIPVLEAALDVVTIDTLAVHFHDTHGQSPFKYLSISPSNVKTPLELSEEEWDHVFNTNLKGSWLVSKYVCIRMCDANVGGSVTNISSIAGLNCGQLPGGIAYASAKAGVNTMTKVMALELGVHKIRVNSISPGLFKSGITDARMQRDWLKNVALRTALLRTFGSSDPALTSLVQCLIHDSSAYVSGNMFIVDAGVALPGTHNGNCSS